MAERPAGGERYEDTEEGGVSEGCSSRGGGGTPKDVIEGYENRPRFSSSEQ